MALEHKRNLHTVSIAHTNKLAAFLWGKKFSFSLSCDCIFVRKKLSKFLGQEEEKIIMKISSCCLQRKEGKNQKRE